MENFGSSDITGVEPVAAIEEPIMKLIEGSEDEIPMIMPKVEMSSDLNSHVKEEVVVDLASDEDTISQRRNLPGEMKSKPKKVSLSVDGKKVPLSNESAPKKVKLIISSREDAVAATIKPVPSRKKRVTLSSASFLKDDELFIEEEKIVNNIRKKKGSSTLKVENTLSNDNMLLDNPVTELSSSFFDVRDEEEPPYVSDDFLEVNIKSETEEYFGTDYVQNVSSHGESGPNYDIGSEPEEPTTKTRKRKWKSSESTSSHDVNEEFNNDEEFSNDEDFKFSDDFDSEDEKPIKSKRKRTSTDDKDYTKNMKKKRVQPSNSKPTEVPVKGPRPPKIYVELKDGHKPGQIKCEAAAVNPKTGVPYIRSDNKYGKWEGRDRRTYYCMFCDYKSSKKHWLKHLKTKHTDKDLIYCTQSTVCNLPFLNQEELDEHKREEHPQHICDHPGCGKVFQYKSLLDSHAKSHLTKEEREIKPSYVCTFCGKKFQSRGGFRSHEANVHTKNLKFKCEMDNCTAAFFDRASLETHIRRHTGELPFTCTYCGVSFASFGILKNHERTKHTELENVKCEICQAEVRKRYLTTHMNIHNGLTKSWCNVCGKEFPTVTSRKRHEKIHFGQKEYACQYCGKAFVQKSNMEAHERIHTGEKPFACKFCGDCFVQQTRRNQHQSGCKQRHFGMDSLVSN